MFEIDAKLVANPFPQFELLHLPRRRLSAAPERDEARAFTVITSVHLARPIRRNQTEARIALVSLGVGIGLDQPTVRGTAKNANHARASPGRQT